MKHDNVKENKLPDNGILVQSRIKRPNFGHNLHSHNHLSIQYIVSGQGILQLKNSTHPLHPNTIITLPTGLLHNFQDKPRKQMTVFSIYFDQQITDANKYIVDYLFDSGQPTTLPVYYSELVRKNLRQMLHEQSNRPPGYKMGITQLFNLTLLNIYRAKLELSRNSDDLKNPKSDFRVQKALDYISVNSHEQFSLSDAAKIAKVSQRQFTNICRKLTAKSFVKFLNQQRCQKAKELIVNTEMSIASIAFEVGYEDLSTFYRAFKSIYRISPLALRDNH